MSGNPFRVSTASGVGFGMFAPAAAPDPSQSEWVTNFQQTMKEIQEKGFQAYAKDINDKKLAEMRQEIRKNMGLSEDDLQKMSPQAQASIERMISEEIRERLAANAQLNGKDQKDKNDGTAGVDGLDARDTRRHRSAEVAAATS